MKGKPNFNPQLARSKVTPRAANNRSKITNGVDLLPGVHKSSLWARRFYDVLFLLLSDLSGEDNCSEGEKAIARRVACLVVELEQLETEFGQGHSTPERLSLYSMLTNTTRRCLETLSSGLQRRQRDITPTLGELLRADHARHAAEATEA